MARSPRGPTFFACAKKVGKETHPWRRALRFAPGPQSVREFSEGASCPCRKRRTSCAPPCGFTRPACHALTGARRAKAKTKATATAERSALALAFGSPSAAVATVGKPAGRCTWMCSVLGRHRMCRPKIPAGDTNPGRAAAGARGPGCAFFGSFLCTSKERDAPRRARHRSLPIAATRASAPLSVPRRYICIRSIKELRRSTAEIPAPTN